MANSNYDRIGSFESLRGLLALWVVLSHLLTISGLDAMAWAGPFKLLARGAYAVDVFIILSGFVICMLLDRNGESYPEFVLRRFLRLFPAYFVCLIAAIVTMPLAVDALQTLPWNTPHNDERLKIISDSMAYFPAQLAAHLFMVHGVFPDSVLPSSPYAFVGQAWSISLEWQFYLIAPLLFSWLMRGSLVFMILGVAAIGMYFLAADWPLSSLPPQFALFMIGIVSYEIWKRRQSIPQKCSMWLLPTSIVLAAVSGKPALLVWVLVYFSILATQCGARGPVENWVLRMLEDRRLRFLGEISYSLYLSHMIVLYVVLYVLAPYVQLLGKGRHFVILSVCVLCVSIVVSSLLHRHVERPGIQAGKQLASRFRSTATTSILNPEQKVRM